MLQILIIVKHKKSIFIGNTSLNEVNEVVFIFQFAGVGPIPDQTQSRVHCLEWVLGSAAKNTCKSGQC